MAALSMLARAELRARWRSLVVLGVLIGVVGAVVLTGLAGARRTTSAHDRLIRATGTGHPGMLTFASGLADRIAALPIVEGAWIARFALGRPDGPVTRIVGVSAGRRRDPGLFTPVIVEGRRFHDDEMDEIVVLEGFARSQGLKPGDTFPMKLLTSKEFGEFDVGFGEPDGPRVALRVTGIARLPGGEETFAVLYGSPALARFVEGRYSAAEASLYRLRGGEPSRDRFREEVRALARTVTPPPGTEEFEPFLEFDVAGTGNAAGAASRVLVAGLLAFAAVAFAVGGFVAVQAISRYNAVSADDRAIESALGTTARQRNVARMIPGSVPGVLGALLAVAGAIAGSPAMPIGSIASIEPAPGVEANVAILAGGGAIIVGLVLVAFVATGIRAARTRATSSVARPSALVEGVAAMGVPPATVVGLRFSLERGRGRTAVPVRSAIIGAALGAAGVLAVAAFATSLDRLVASPARWGWQGDLQVIDLKPEEERRLLADDRVAGLARLANASAGLRGGGTVDASSFTTRRGSLGWTMLEGRMPRSPDQVAIGPRVAKRMALKTDGTMTFVRPSDGAAREKLVVGIGVGPVIGSFGDSVVMTPEGFAEVARSQPFVEGYVDLADGVDLEAFVSEFGTSEIEVREPPPDVANLGGLGRLPDALAAILALVAVTAIAHALFVGVRRRSRDIAVLRALGFVRSQVARAVRVSAVTTLLIALAIGVPVGLVIGSVSWRAVASSAYVAGDTAVPSLVLAVMVPAALAVALALSVWPARRAARLRPAEILRSE